MAKGRVRSLDLNRSARAREGNASGFREFDAHRSRIVTKHFAQVLAFLD